MKICVTGSAGYVGSYLAKKLIELGNSVLLIDNYFIPSHITEINGTKIQHRDIREKIDLSDFDVLVHLAAISGINKCNENEQLAINVNVKGTINLLRHFHGKVVFASTSAVYGEANQPIIDETHSTNPLGVYGITKLSGEETVEMTGKYVNLRFSNIYGKGITWKRITGKNVPIIYKDVNVGRKWKDFLYSSKKANMMLNYDPIFSVSDEIADRLKGSLR